MYKDKLKVLTSMYRVSQMLHRSKLLPTYEEVMCRKV